MEQQDNEQSNISKELEAVGFLSNLAKKGLVTWMFGFVATLLFISIMLNIWLVKVNTEIGSGYNKVFREMVQKAAQTEIKVDTTLKKP